MADGAMRGEVDLQLKWVHNPSIAEPDEPLSKAQMLLPTDKDKVSHHAEVNI